MLKFFKKTNQWLGESDFLTKSAFGVSVVSFVVLLPFGINNFLQGRLTGGVIVLCVALLCAFNAFLGSRGRYSLHLNLFAIVPAITLGIVNAIVTLGVIGSYWAYLGVFAVYFILPLQPAKYANIFFLISVISAAWFSLEPAVYMRFSAVLVGASFFIFISNREITKAQSLLRKQSITDSLTGLNNRVVLAESLQLAILEFENNNVKSSVCVLDLDYFKQINDNFGHDVGDKVLLALAKHLQEFASSKDILFRIGGEEFLILMKNTDITEAKKTADAMRATVECLDVLKDHTITVSIGVTEVKPNLTWKEWMKESDDKLYRAKQNGRNQVIA